MAQTHAHTEWPPTKQAWLVTSLLLLAYILSFIDRQILNLLAPAIQADLNMSDVEMSLLQGPAFAATYILLSVPLGQMTDTLNRTKLLAAGLGFWTLATMACGFSRSFWPLAISRAGVGLGEATLTPTAWSILADSFPPHKRSTPVSIYLTGPYVGGGLALVLGGQLLGWFDGPSTFMGMTFQPWQICFILIASPGILLAIAMAGAPEPKRILAQDEKPETATMSAFGGLLRGQWRIYAGLWLGAGQIAVILYGLQAWTPTLLTRVHGWTIGEAGLYYGLTALIAGSIGVLNGPIIHRWLMERTGKDYSLYIGFACGILLAIISPLILYVDGIALLLAIGLLSYLVTTPMTLMTTTLQLVTPNLFRGRASGVHVVATNLLGLGFGPTYVAWLTERVFADSMAVGHSMMVQSITFGLGAAICYLIGAKPVMELAARQTAPQP